MMKALMKSFAILGLVLFVSQTHAGDRIDGYSADHRKTRQLTIKKSGESGPVSQQLSLPLGQAAIVHLPTNTTEVVAANDAIADALVRSPKRALVLGQEVGSTNIFFFDEYGDLILDLSVNVERDVEALNDALVRYIPDGQVSAESLNSNIVLSGSVPSASAADLALQVARRWVEKPEQVVSFVNIEGREQVQLRVRIVEMERTIVRQLGVNLDGTHNYGDYTPPVYKNVLGVDGSPVMDTNGNPLRELHSAGRYQSSSKFGTENGFGVAGAALGGLKGTLGTQNLVNGVVQSSISATLNALERVGVVRTLAEPTITAISGESANFLAGGEFPVPVGRDSEGALAIEYKPFGVGLGFTPIVLSEGRISLRVSTEVSELSSEGAITIGGQIVENADGTYSNINSTRIPGLAVNRTETSVEMPSGGSLVIAGLIKEETRQALDSVPGIERLPVLGSLFRSRDFESGKTELAFIITPYLVESTNKKNLSLPGEGLVASSVIEGLFLGRLNSVYAAPGADVEGQAWVGPVGYTLD